MKSSISAVIILFVSLTVFAQENKVVKEETTVKKVVTKEGSKVTVKEVKETKKEEGAVVIEGSEKEEQEFKVATKEDKDAQVVADQVAIDERNEALIAAEKKRQEEALQRSIEEQKAKAEAEKKALEAQKKARLEELEKRREELESRPKGMVKLKKSKDN